MIVNSIRIDSNRLSNWTKLLKIDCQIEWNWFKLMQNWSSNWLKSIVALIQIDCQWLPLVFHVFQYPVWTALLPGGLPFPLAIITCCRCWLPLDLWSRSTPYALRTSRRKPQSSSKGPKCGFIMFVTYKEIAAAHVSQYNYHPPDDSDSSTEYEDGAAATTTGPRYLDVLEETGMPMARWVPVWSPMAVSI